jgi:hypothetical protein
MMRADHKAFNNDEFDRVNRLCRAAEAKDPASENTDPHYKVVRMAGVCLRDKICP